MKNSKDKNIIRLLLIFIAYYLISFYMPNLFPQYGKVINMLVFVCAVIYKNSKS